VTGGRRFAWVVVATLAVLAPTVRWRNLTDCAGSSRLATAESLVERHSFVIDGSTFAYTCDVMMKDGQRYSDKPPLLSVAAAGVYAALHHGLGLSFNRASNPYVNTVKDPTYYLMTLLISSLAVALVAALVDRELRRLGFTSVSAGLGAGLAVFATLLWPLSTVLTNHTVAAALLFAGFVQAFRREGRTSSLAAGALLALLLGVDIPLGALALAVAGLDKLRRVPREALAFAAGALPPLLLHGLLNWTVVGDLKPFQSHRELYNERTGHTGESASGFAPRAGVGLYLWRNTVGSLGVLSLTPLLLPALVGAFRLRRSQDVGRFATASLVVYAALTGLYTLIYPDAVGCSYGMRHLSPVMPLLVFLGVIACVRASGQVYRRAFVITSLVSLVFAGLGVLIPTNCAGFVTDADAWIPARLVGTAVRHGILRRLAP